ncbi:cyclic GMP-AMP synthase [Nematolebias whitei]|uniref:cyclic GMP-AMP synthase n=1 Tax=Nematolebias whitei TaxID=451745 RepID=UPI001899567F|nr:cyclic GMP-AMP synthase [Nematolebias whitei]
MLLHTLAQQFHSSHFIMSCRGKPRTAENHDTNLKEVTSTSPGRLRHTAFEETTKKPKKQGQQTQKKSEEKSDGPKTRQGRTTQDQQTQKKSEEKPDGPKTRQGRTTNPFTEKRLDIPANGTKAKTCSTRKTSMETTTGDDTNTKQKPKPETHKDISKTSPKTTTKVKTPKATLLVQFFEDPTNAELHQAAEIKTHTLAAAKPTKAKTRANNATRGRTEAQPDGAEDRTVDCILKKTLNKLKIKTKERSDAARVINDFIKHLIKYLKENTISFKEVGEPLRTGSYYEHLKISNPDEFDIMLPILAERIQIEPFKMNGAFYSVALKREMNPLKKFQQNNILSGFEMLKEFRKEVKTFAKGFSEWTMTSKKTGCPAVTLTTLVETTTISLDIVLCLQVNSHWPTFTDDGLKIEQWLGDKVKQKYKWKPYYLVPKYEGKGTEENEGVLAKDVWRISFSHVEKDIMNNHGSKKTCCEKSGTSCCRKDCLKLLKYLLHLRKEKDSSMSKFCSYHAKTTLLHACCSKSKDSDWKVSNLRGCFEHLLQEFEGHLKNVELYNFFIPSQNLLSDIRQNRCITLANWIKEQRETGFPVFQQDLQDTN